MNKLIAILALGVCFSNVYAKNPKRTKQTKALCLQQLRKYLSPLSKTRTSRALAGHSLHWDSWKPSCCVPEKVTSTCLKCLWYTKPWKTVP